MKKSQSFFALLIFCLSFVFIPAIAKASMWDVPVGPGEKFRWVFVTSLTTDATSPDITTYNNLVNKAVEEANTSITGVVGISSLAEIQWKAIASTVQKNAKWNIGGESVVDIYLAGTPHMVADGTADLFDGFINSPIFMTEKGTTYTGLYPRVWTGTYWDGLSWPHLVNPLGAECGQSGTGDASHVGNEWLYGGPALGNIPQLNQYPLYAISQELTVVPVPSALILGATGLLSSTLGLIRLRRKHQEPSQI